MGGRLEFDRQRSRWRGAINVGTNSQPMFFRAWHRQLGQPFCFVADHQYLAPAVAWREHSKTANIVRCIYPQTFFPKLHVRNCVVERKAWNRVVWLGEAWDEHEAGRDIQRLQ